MPVRDTHKVRQREAIPLFSRKTTQKIKKLMMGVAPSIFVVIVVVVTIAVVAKCTIRSCITKLLKLYFLGEEKVFITFKTQVSNT